MRPLKMNFILFILLFFSLIVSSQNIGINEPNPKGEFHVSDPFQFQGVTFMGTGVDDLIADVSGFTGSGAINFLVEIIDAVSEPNLFWVSIDGGETWSAEILIDSVPINLGFGVWISFASTTGHDLFDIWSFEVEPDYLNGLLVKNGKVGIGTTNPNYELDVIGDLNVSGQLYNSGSVMEFVEEIDDLQDAKALQILEDIAIHFWGTKPGT